MKTTYNIDKLIEIDNSGMPKAPGIRQLLDKDILQLYTRDISSDKQQYIKECGVIYYLGDPKSPAMQQGLTRSEAIKLAIENFDLPKDYEPDNLVLKIAKKYHTQNITEAGVAIENLHSSLHLASIQASKINELLSKKIMDDTSEEDLRNTMSLINDIRTIINSIPAMTKALATAYENLESEEEKEYHHIHNFFCTFFLDEYPKHPYIIKGTV